MRRPSPFYRKARNSWYVEINGKQVKLGAVESKTRTPPDDIMREFHRLMAGEGMLSERERQQATVPVVVEALIESKSATRSKTIKACVYYLEPFAVKFKSRRLDSIRTTEVMTFVNKQATWGDSTKHSAIAYIKGLFRWARDSGFLDLNPMAGIANPFPVGSRERGITVDEFKMLIEATRDEAFKTVLRFLRDTGCRPGDLCVLSARHLHPELPIATLKPHEHKTGSRTGKPKDIILPGSLADEMRQLAKVRPTGPLLLNTDDTPWIPDTIRVRFTRLRKKLNLPADVVPYASRTAFLTRLIENGVSLAIAAKIAGHSRTDTIMSSYLRPEMKSMMQAVDDAAGVKSKAETADETIARLQTEIATLRAKVNSTL